MAKRTDARVRPATTESVAEVLERERDGVIRDWMALVEKQEDLNVGSLELLGPYRELAKAVARCDCAPALESRD